MPDARNPTTPAPEAHPKPLSALRRWLALAVLVLPVLLISVGNTVLTFALPDISRALQPSGTSLLWIVDVYPLVMAGFLLPMGSLGDRFGRRRMLLIGSLGFTAVSAAATFAPTAEWLIGTRALLGFFGAMLMPSTLSLLRNVFVERRERQLAIAIWAAGFAVGAALGPLLGGLLLEHFAWGAVFLLALPVLIPLLVLAPLLLPESRDPYPARVDPLSVLLSLTTMVPSVLAIKMFVVGDIVFGIGMLTLGLVSGAAFIRRQLTRTEPMVDLSLFRARPFSAALAVNLLSCVAFVGFLFFTSQHLQLVLGLAPLDAGMALVPGLVAMMVASVAVVPIARRVRSGALLCASLTIAVAGYLVIAIAPGPASVTLLMLAFAVLGIGIGAAQAVSNELAITSAPAPKAGAAAALSETAYELGAVLGTAVLGSILTMSYRASVVVPDGLTHAQAIAARETLGGASELARELSPALAEQLLASARDAFVSGVGMATGVGALLTAAAAAIAAISLRRV